ncbi:hypothetical protein J6590_027129 [Homalodisca vitripennis]|nr:hypothetical protein J6590_027129 [Homalodisca vitripennis]
MIGPPHMIVLRLLAVSERLIPYVTRASPASRAALPHTRVGTLALSRTHARTHTPLSAAHDSIDWLNTFWVRGGLRVFIVFYWLTGSGLLHGAVRNRQVATGAQEQVSAANCPVRLRFANFIGNFKLKFNWPVPRIMSPVPVIVG